MQRGIVVLAVSAILFMVPQPANTEERVEFCGFTISIPLGWVHEETNRGPHPVLRMKPRCLCELELQEHRLEEDSFYWFVNRGPSPVVLECTKETPSDVYSKGTGALSPTPSGFEVGGAIWGTERAGEFSGKGWNGIGGSYTFRVYYWKGGNAGSDTGFFAAVYSNEGPVMHVFVKLFGHDLEAVDILAHISHPRNANHGIPNNGKLIAYTQP